MANLPAIFLLSPRNPNPTIAQRNTSFPLGAFYPHLMFLYFFILGNLLNISQIKCTYILLYYRREISLRSFREIEKHVIPN